MKTQRQPDFENDTERLQLLFFAYFRHTGLLIGIWRSANVIEHHIRLQSAHITETCDLFT